MIISILNFSEISDADVQVVLKRLDSRLTECCFPNTGSSGILQLENTDDLSLINLKNSEENGIIYLWGGKPDLTSAIRFHNKHCADNRYGFVFTAISPALGECWSESLFLESIQLLMSERFGLPEPVDTSDQQRDFAI